MAALKVPRARRIGKWLAGLLVAFGLFGFLAGPPLMKWLLVKQLSQELQREVSIEKIDINPYALSARVSGVSVKAEGGGELAGFDELFVNLSSFSLAQFGAVVDEIRLQGPRVAVTRIAEGKYDISDLLEKWLKPSEPSPTPRFSINNIQIIGGKAVFDDQPMGRVHTVSDINLAIPFISSLPYQAERLVEPSFSAVVDGAPFALKGKSKEIFEGNQESELNLDLDRLDLAGFQPYLPSFLPLRLNGGLLDTELRVVFKELSDKVFSLTVEGGAHISGFDLAEASGAPLVRWKRLDVDVGGADLVNRRFTVNKVVLDGMDAYVAVSKQGEMNWVRLLAEIAADAPEGKPDAPPAKAPEWTVGEVRLSNGTMHWQDESTIRPTVGAALDINVVVGKIEGKLAAPIEISEASYRVDLGDRLRIGRMAAKGVQLDLHGHRIDVAEANTHELRLRLVRNKEGKIEWVSSPILKTVRTARQELADERPWLAGVGRLVVDDLAVRVEDQTTSPVAVQSIDGFTLTADNLSTEPGKKGSISLKSQVNQKGSLRAEGSVQLMPLKTALKVETQAVPILPLQPYFTNYLNIELTRGLLSNVGEVNVEMAKEGLNAAYKGSLTLGDLVAVDKVNNADFLKWKSLYLGGIDFRLQPMAVNVGEVALSDFYSRLILSKEGRLNLQDIVRTSGGAAKPDEATPSAAAPKAADPAPASKQAAVPVRIGKVTLQGGTVNFSDFFVKPNYTVNVTKVAGRVSGLSSTADTVADLELRGSYANSAPVQVVGKLNPLAAKSFLDIKAEVKGVDLVAFSPYSGKYAGYNIDKGKLSLNVAYKLENKQLTADNRLFIDQLTFGDKVESPDATKLPVNLAIALLKNNRGEIDLNLPISGSLDDPEFSIGGLVVKVIINLFVKAVTSPFALLGSMFGGGEELSNIEFAPGRATVNDAATKRLESLAKALTERDSLKLEITGRADPEADKEGIKRVAVDRAVKAEKLKDQLKKGGEGGSVDAVEVTPAEYPVYLQRAYKEAKFPKPRNLIGMQKDLPVEEMEKLMLANTPATDDDVQQLALRRAENVQGWLINEGKVPSERLFLVEPKAEAGDKDKGSRVDFSLR
ncbi:MAG: DUF748 domain-containing protein [Dechloromonas sp.]|nr:DUF748 domain-containing protein [Dechloromonas sp.]